MAKKADFNLIDMNKFMNNLNKEIRELEGRTHAGLIDAAIILQRKAYNGIPIDTSNLAHSWFTVSYKQSGNVVPSPQGETFKGSDAATMKTQHNRVVKTAEAAVKTVGSDQTPVLVFGYSANYAVYVHENIDATFKRPKAHARWLYIAMQRNQEEMLEAIRQRAAF